MRLAFGTQAYKLRTLPLSAQDLINYHVVPAPPAADTFAAVVPDYGILELVRIGTGFFRGGEVINGVPYVVVGQTLYRITVKFVAEALGTIPGDKFVDIVGDETHVVLLASGRGFVYDNTGINEITAEGFPKGATWLEEVAGYYLAGFPDSEEFALSNNRAPLEWDSLDFASAEQYPDDVIRGKRLLGEVVMFGRESYEIFYDSGNADFPFTREPNGFGEIGLISRYAVVSSDSSLFFVGHDGVIYRLNGYKAIRISTDAIEQAIEDAADKTCFMLSWNEGGSKFISVSFDDKTFAFNIATQLWNRKQSYGLNRWRPLFILRAYDQWLTGDFYSNILGALDANTFTEFGNVLRGVIVSPPVTKDNQIVAHDRLELLFEQGVGLQEGQGFDPQVMLRFSDTAGRKWSGEKWRPIGKVGEYLRRALWNRLGSARHRIYELTISDPVPRTLVLALTDVVIIGN